MRESERKEEKYRIVSCFLLLYSWCPDCVRADPLIQQALGEITEGYILLEVSVVREEFRATDYKFRVDPQLKLNCVPTLLKWGRSGPIARLNDAQSQDIELVRELVVA